MQDAERPEELVRWVDDLNAIAWRTRAEITASARDRIARHIERTRAAVAFLVASQSMTPVSAYDRTLSGGFRSPGYDQLVDLLFERVTFRNAVVSEHLILVLAAHYFWERDDEFGHLANPWEPLFALYQEGYPTSVEIDDRAQTIDLFVGYRGGIEKLRLIPALQ